MGRGVMVGGGVYLEIGVTVGRKPRVEGASLTIGSRERFQYRVGVNTTHADQRGKYRCQYDSHVDIVP